MESLKAITSENKYFIHRYRSRALETMLEGIRKESSYIRFQYLTSKWASKQTKKLGKEWIEINEDEAAFKIVYLPHQLEQINNTFPGKNYKNATEYVIDRLVSEYIGNMLNIGVQIIDDIDVSDEFWSGVAYVRVRFTR